ncbi:kinesin-like protein KIF22 [Prunus yedoensis var. nudiflora]|uniref:Kinesin-like protein KIF22 n=1 Tax=Prunus yedoensis var. nudiflora TaxID=2094558 RepID=A0A314XIN8_PRUYE|nr:kinesin-like protein KIF22 [Prunus yedoensis var. nudiflora]
MASRNRVHSLPEKIHSLLGLKSHLTSSWVKSVCDIIRNQPSQGQSTETHLTITNFEINNCSENRDDDDDLSNAASNIRDELAILTAHINELNKQRRQVLNEFLDLKGNIRVLCRIRPITTGENFGRFRPVVALDSSNVHLRLTDDKSKSYSFDVVFHPGSSQDEVFSEVEPVIKSALDGYNACIFAYGQTGTGKTFTMEGTPDFPGVVPRAIEALFKQAVDSNHVFLFSFSMLEIYMGNLKDLLIPQPTKAMDPLPPCLSIQTDPKGGIEIENLVAIQVSDFNQALRLYRLGCRFRSTASTNCNVTSSRSHCLIRISVTCSGAPERRRETNKVWFVDLGGSERLLKTKAWGRRLEEGKAINLSLSSLGDVINALQTRKGHVPYRNSKLTQVLKDSLGKDSKTLMLVHISPKEEDLCETVCSLNFATRVRSVHLGNTDSTEERQKEVAMINLQQKMKMIEVERQDVRMSIKKLNEELEKLTGTTQSSSEKLDADNLFNDLPQANLEINRSKTRNIAAAPSSQVPRFMRPTICSRRKSGPEHLTFEERVRFPARRRRPMNHHAKSVNFPVNGTTENNSECSISRNSCLVALKMKRSADVETEYSQDLSECDIKEVVFPEQEASPKCSNHHRDHSEEYENRHKSNACSAEYYVDKWLLLNKNAPATRSHFHRNKRIPAIPTPEKKRICNGQKERDHLQDKEVQNRKKAIEQIVSHNKLEKYADVEGTQRSMQEVVITKPPKNSKDFDNIDSRCNSDSPSDEFVEDIIIHTKDKLDGVPMETHICNTIYPPDISYSSLHSNKDDNGVNTLSPMEVPFGETESSDSFLSNNSNWCQISTSNLAYSILDSREDSGISISRIELNSGCQQVPTTIRGEECEKEDLDTLFQSSAEGIRHGLHKMRSQRALFMEYVTPKEAIKPQQLIKSQENDMNSGIRHLLQQKIQILWASALLGLGFQNLGLEQEFFLGLIL